MRSAGFQMSNSVRQLILTQRRIKFQFVRSASSIDASVSHEATTGAFKSILPEIFSGATHYKRALKSLSMVKLDDSIRNARNKQRKHAAQSLDVLMKGLTVPITKTLNAYSYIFSSIHPYEAAVANLTIVARQKAGYPGLADVIQRVKKMRAATSTLAKSYAAKASQAKSAAEARQILEEGQNALCDLYEKSELAQSLDELLAIHKELRRIPVIDLSLPTVVLLGSPNVGKSSIVRAISSGTPEVNDYPFTTRGVSIGHIIDESRDLKFQVMDTPGLLDRPDEERNEMEKLTYASLAHLPTAAIFVIDPTGLSGAQSSLQAQLNVRKVLKARFPKRPWVDIISKGDLIVPDKVLSQLPSEALTISVRSGMNISILKRTVEQMLSSRFL